MGLLLPTLAFAAKPDREVQVPWTKLGKLIRGKNAEVVTITRESIRGTIRAVTANGLVVDDRRVPRSDVHAVTASHSRLILPGSMLWYTARVRSVTVTDPRSG